MTTKSYFKIIFSNDKKTNQIQSNKVYLQPNSEVTELKKVKIVIDNGQVIVNAI